MPWRSPVQSFTDPAERLQSSGHLSAHLLSYRDEVRGRVWSHVSFPQTRLKQRGPAWSASNNLSITGMPGEVRAHCVPCHFPWCPISLPSCPVARSLRSLRTEHVHDAVLEGHNLVEPRYIASLRKEHVHEAVLLW